jgi:hypothetical protein
MSGAILADSAVQEGGRIMLLARGGNIDVSGNLSARGTVGGQIDMLGDQVHLASTAKLDADGVYGGGTLHVGGAYQGSGDTYRAQSTQVDAGATLQASAVTQGNGGEVVVWSDGRTAYAGSIEARGGAAGGDGGLVEVSGKQILGFTGQVDAGATNGRAGSLLLDPYNFTIGMAEAGLLNRVLRSGTNTSVSADNDIDVNYLIDGRGLNAGGGLTLSAGNNINVNNYIITNNGAINLYANSGTINLASGKVVYAGTAPITVRSGSDLYYAPYLTGGPLSLISTMGSVFINQGIDSSVGNLFIQAAVDVNVNKPIISRSDSNIHAGRDISLNDVSGGGDLILHAGRDINLSNVSRGGDLTLTAGRYANLNAFYTIESLNVTAGNDILFSSGGLTTPHATVWLNGGNLMATSTGGSILVNYYSAIHIGGGKSLALNAYGSVELGILETLGPVSITAQTGYISLRNDIGPPIPSFDPDGNGVASLMLNAGGNINMQGAKAAGAVTITSGGALTATGNVPLDNQGQLLQVPPNVGPAYSPGPTLALPGAEASVSESENAIIRVGSSGQLSEIIPVEDEEEGEEENRKKILKISYERSARQVAELGLR